MITRPSSPEPSQKKEAPQTADSLSREIDFDIRAMIRYLKGKCMATDPLFEKAIELENTVKKGREEMIAFLSQSDMSGDIEGEFEETVKPLKERATQLALEIEPEADALIAKRSFRRPTRPTLKSKVEKQAQLENSAS